MLSRSSDPLASLSAPQRLAITETLIDDRKKALLLFFVAKKEAGSSEATVAMDEFQTSLGLNPPGKLIHAWLKDFLACGFIQVLRQESPPGGRGRHRDIFGPTEIGRAALKAHMKVTLALFLDLS